jgi:hypothetical protein
MTMLTARERGKSMMVALFASEQDRRQGHETLNAMSPPLTDGMGRRVAVEMFDVPLQMEGRPEDPCLDDVPTDVVNG